MLAPVRSPSRRWSFGPSLALSPLVALAVAAGFVATAWAEDTSKEVSPEIAKVLELGAQDSQVMPLLDHLVNQIGPRLTGSHNIARAYEWTKGQFQSFGLSNVHTETWGKYDVGFDRAGPSTGTAFVSGADAEVPARAITIGSFAWTAGTDGPARGQAIWEPRNDAEYDAVKGQLKGAWLVSRSGRNMPFGDAMAGRGSRKERQAFRKKLEDAGILGFVRGMQSDLILTDGRPDGLTMDKLPKIPSVNTTHDDWKFVSDHLKAGHKVELELDVKNRFFDGPVEHKNVIADIPGTEKPDEFVIVGGHLDSWDGATGTTDNGTGVATTLEAARLLAKAGARPKRTIRFILWSGEEQGLLGSESYVKTHKAELPKVSCILIHDGGTNYVSGIGLTKAMYPVAAPALHALEGLDKDMPFKVKKVKTLPFGVGSDHDSFLAKGVPGFFWQQEGRQDYDHEHHTQYDTFSAAIPEYQRHSARTIAAGALAIANLDQLLPREGMLPPMPKRLGVQTGEDLTIQKVVEDSLAEKAGLEEGDKIVQIGKSKVSNLQELREAIQASEGETEVRYVRDGVEKSATVEFETAKKEQPKKRWY